MMRYLGAVAICVLIVGWVTVAALQGMRLYKTSELADGVAIGTETVRRQLREPRLDVLQDMMFPEGRIIGAVKETWGTGIKVKSYPSSLIGETQDASGRAPTPGLPSPAAPAPGRRTAAPAPSRRTTTPWPGRQG